MLTCYYNSISGNYHVSEDFTVKEFQCKDKSDIVLIDSRLVEILQMIREHFKKPVIINSAYRTPSWNKRVNGAKYSYHQVGMAADIQIKDISTKDIAKVASDLLMDEGGVIRYTNFVHVDVRSKRYRKGVS